jgi:hypothetical protein
MSGEAPGPTPIRIEPDARAFLASQGGVATLRGSRRHGCCGGTAFVPVAERGPPDEPEHYQAYNVDGITVYLERDVAFGPEPLVVGLDELWRWQRLRVEGTAIRM